MKPLLADSPPSLLKFTAQQTSLIALHTFPSQAFGINADQWTIAAQNKGKWRRTAEQGAERFIAKWIAEEKARAGLGYVIVWPNATGRTKERIAQSKRARAGSFAIVD